MKIHFAGTKLMFEVVLDEDELGELAEDLWKISAPLSPTGELLVNTVKNRKGEKI